MKYIALTGPQYSGKTRLSAEMAKRGYLYINFSDVLKQHLTLALSAVGVSVTVQDIHQDKPKYRRLLQEFGSLVNFDRDPYFITKSLQPWFELDRPPAVFDNVRFLEQYVHLYAYDFKLVQLNIGKVSQYRRAKLLHPELTIPQFQADHQHQAEAGIDGAWIDLMLDATQPVEYLAEDIIRYGELPAVRGRAP